MLCPVFWPSLQTYLHTDMKHSIGSFFVVRCSLFLFRCYHVWPSQHRAAPALARLDVASSAAVTAAIAFHRQRRSDAGTHTTGLDSSSVFVLSYFYCCDAHCFCLPAFSFASRFFDALTLSIDTKHASVALYAVHVPANATTTTTRVHKGAQLPLWLGRVAFDVWLCTVTSDQCVCLSSATLPLSLALTLALALTRTRATTRGTHPLPLAHAPPSWLPCWVPLHVCWCWRRRRFGVWLRPCTRVCTRTTTTATTTARAEADTDDGLGARHRLVHAGTRTRRRTTINDNDDPCHDCLQKHDNNTNRDNAFCSDFDLI